MTIAERLPRWSVTDLHESYESRSFLDALERSGADTDRLEALFEHHDIRATPPRAATEADGAAADAVIRALNDWQEQLDELEAFVYASVSTNSFDERAQSLSSQLEVLGSRGTPLLARLVEWVGSLGVDALAEVSVEAGEHTGPLRRLAERAAHQMSEIEEGLYSELSSTGWAAWRRLHSDVTSQLMGDVQWPDGTTRRLPMSAVRGLATHVDPAVRRAAYDAELVAWPTIAVTAAAALNAVKGEANIVDRRRNWSSPLDASLYGNNVSRQTFEAMRAAMVDALPDFRGWMRSKARLLGHSGPLPWHDLLAPLPSAASEISWDQGVEIVRTAFDSYGGTLGEMLTRAIDEEWIDAEPREGKRGGAFCMSFFGDRSLVFLNWTGSVDSAQTTAHELGHAYHNTQLAHRTPLQRRLPMALAETASIFCETLVVEEGLERLQGAERLALLDVDLQGTTQVIVDIYSRLLFETELFARRQQRTLGVTELNDMMRSAQLDAYGDGLDQTTAHPYMWVVKPHYYSAHFYNWPYAYGQLFGLGLFARFRADADAFRRNYDDVLSRVGMSSAEDLGAAFDLDVTDVAFWTASLDVVRGRIAEYDRLVAELGL